MSFLTSRLAARPAASLRSANLATKIPRPAVSCFHTSPLRAALSESDRNEEREGVDREIESHKEDQLNKQEEGKGHWKGELSSNSEAAVKADRGEIHASQKEISKMQKETEEMGKKSHGQ